MQVEPIPRQNWPVPFALAIQQRPFPFCNEVSIVACEPDPPAIAIQTDAEGPKLHQTTVRRRRAATYSSSLW